MEAFKSTTSFGSRTRLCSLCVTIFIQKVAVQYRCWSLVACRKILTLTFTEISSQQGKLRRQLALAPPPSTKNIDHDQVCTFDCRNSNDVNVFDRGAISGVNSYAVDINGPERRHQVSIARLAKHMFDRFADP